MDLRKGLNPLWNVSQCEEKSTKCLAWLSFMTSVQGLLPNILEVTRDTLKTMQNQLWNFKFGVQIFLFFRLLNSQFMFWKSNFIFGIPKLFWTRPRSIKRRVSDSRKNSYFCRIWAFLAVRQL